ncbi:hypothetical protein RhiirC2_793435 [Rhizophagus irregularis]|uniref:Uncharacterized protein n=1 Tax=Rhizophagus irregularis TaxID=588596 RepID=A0A2N1MFG0_9GLOM|nr:hypothetical protein RhiirC2_793435 [Rhizophagus irregularis]
MGWDLEWDLGRMGWGWNLGLMEFGILPIPLIWAASIFPYGKHHTSIEVNPQLLTLRQLTVQLTQQQLINDEHKNEKSNMKLKINQLKDQLSNTKN